MSPQTPPTQESSASRGIPQSSILKLMEMISVVSDTTDTRLGSLEKRLDSCLHDLTAQFEVDSAARQAAFAEVQRDIEGQRAQLSTLLGRGEKGMLAQPQVPREMLVTLAAVCKDVEVMQSQQMRHDNAVEALRSKMGASAQQMSEGWGSERRLSTAMAAIEEIPRRIGDDMQKVASHVVDHVQTEVAAMSKQIKHCEWPPGTGNEEEYSLATPAATPGKRPAEPEASGSSGSVIKAGILDWEKRWTPEKAEWCCCRSPVKPQRFEQLHVDVAGAGTGIPSDTGPLILGVALLCALPAMVHVFRRRTSGRLTERRWRSRPRASAAGG